MRYRLAVFDFDGTLADSFPFFLDAVDTLADAHGFRRVDRSQLAALRMLDARQMLRHVGLPLWKVPRVGAHFKTLMAQNTQRITLFPGIAPMLQRLHAHGVELAILTSNSEENVRTVLGTESAELIRYWQCGSALFGKRDKLRRLLAQSGVERNAVLCIGDEMRDFEAASREQIHFGAVAWGYTNPQAFSTPQPRAVFHSPDDITRMLLEPTA